MNCEMLWTASPRPLKKERKENQESVSLPSVQTLTSKQDKSGLRFTKYFKSNPPPRQDSPMIVNVATRESKTPYNQLKKFWTRPC